MVGKTNEDEDRATIANITGNGNDLVLSNFGFAEGIVYDENWNPISVKVGSLEEYRNKLLLGYLSNLFTQIAFKNMSIYSNQVLSKEDCIKAYNYLQTLKAK